MRFRIFAPCFNNEARNFFVNMGRKLTKSELKRITEVAKMERRKSGVKNVEKVVHYNMKWQDAIRRASKKVLAERRVKQKRIRFK